MMKLINLTQHKIKFQHSAARRRLHSGDDDNTLSLFGFNTQPRGGGC